MMFNRKNKRDEDKRKNSDYIPEQAKEIMARNEERRAKARVFNALWLNTPTHRAYLDEDSGRVYHIYYTPLGFLTYLVVPPITGEWVEIRSIMVNEYNQNGVELWERATHLLPDSVLKMMITPSDGVFIGLDGELVQYPAPSTADEMPLPDGVYLSHLAKIVMQIWDNYLGIQGEYGTETSYIGKLPVYESDFRDCANRLLSNSIPTPPNGKFHVREERGMYEYATSAHSIDIKFTWALVGDTLTIDRMNELPILVINLVEKPIKDKRNE